MTDNVRHSSESAEHFTPPDVVNRARSVLGGFDLDPATTERANAHIVRAEAFHTAATNGYLTPWSGRTFLNPPGGKCDNQGITVGPVKKEHRTLPSKGEWSCVQSPGGDWVPCRHVHEDVMSSQKRWWQKLLAEWESLRVPSAFFVGFSLEILQVAQNECTGRTPIDFPFCVPASRIAYYRDVGDGFEEGSSPPHASVLIYLPPPCARRDIESKVSIPILTSEGIYAFTEEFEGMGRVVTAHFNEHTASRKPW